MEQLTNGFIVNGRHQFTQATPSSSNCRWVRWLVVEDYTPTKDSPPESKTKDCEGGWHSLILNRMKYYYYYSSGRCWSIINGGLYLSSTSSCGWILVQEWIYEEVHVQILKRLHCVPLPKYCNYSSAIVLTKETSKDTTIGAEEECHCWRKSPLHSNTQIGRLCGISFWVLSPSAAIVFKLIWRPLSRVNKCIV